MNSEPTTWQYLIEGPFKVLRLWWKLCVVKKGDVS
jgi:hypothetical protein